MAQTATYMRRVLIKTSPTVTGPAVHDFYGDYSLEERCRAIEESAAMFESKVKCAEDGSALLAVDTFGGVRRLGGLPAGMGRYALAERYANLTKKLRNW